MLASVASGVPEINQSGYRVVQYPLPKGSTTPFAIAVDNKTGNVWFVEQGSNQIGMLDPSSGVIREYSIPTASSTPTAIAVDSFGNVWFSELSSNRLGELKDGVITEFDVPSSSEEIQGHSTPQSCGPTEVVPRAQDRIWVVCIFSNEIDEFFPANETFQSFELPVFLSGPAGLVFDKSGNFWFTAADAEMIGHGIVSELKNGTSSGITEFAPINKTYVFSFKETTSYLGSTKTVESSLPTPSGIGISPDGNTLWISEHVDSSFDSYNIQTGSLDRYWTSQTDDQYGYSVSLPNGLVINDNGTVWIAEHYGNKIAEFDPYAGTLTEYLVPCCNSSIAGPYTLTLGQNGTVWFVEIVGNAIGELIPATGNFPTLDIELGRQLLTAKSPSTTSIPLRIVQHASSNQSDLVSLEISGVSGTGILSGASAVFEPPTLELSGTQSATSELDLTIQALKPGIYDLTVSAKPAPYGVIYSTIMKLEVFPPQNEIFTYTVLIGVTASCAILAFHFFRVRRKRSR